MENDPIVANPIWKGRDFSLDENLCFVIMPFKLEWSEAISDYIKIIAAKFNLNAKRADSVTGHIIMEDVWRLINEARIIIVDVTANNPNVFYELGIAHTLGKNIILLAQNTDNIPFDISSYRHILYKGDTSAFKILDEKLSEHIKNIIKDSPNGDPIIDDVIKKMNHWRTQGYDFDLLLNPGKLRILKKFIDVDNLKDDVLAYCFISSIYFGNPEEMFFWFEKNKNNINAAKILGQCVLMPYRRPKFRSAFIIQFLNPPPKSEALSYIKNDSPKHKLLRPIEESKVKEYIEENIKIDPELISTNSKQLLGEFTSFEKLFESLTK